MDINHVNIVKSFLGKAEIYSLEKYGKGHINQTYLTSTSKGKYILQNVNTNVFDIGKLIKNYNLLHEYVNKQNVCGKFFPNFATSNGEVHIKDDAGNYWRLIEYQNDSQTYSLSPSYEISRLAGAAVANFQCFLDKLDKQQFEETISNFHNPEMRYRAFKQAVESSEQTLVRKSSNEVKKLMSLSSIVDDTSKILNDSRLTYRLTHNDPKLENILFFPTKAPVVIDLDTVMKGTVIFDFGDMVRSITPQADENEKELSKVRFHRQHFEALAEGYITSLKSNVTEFELQNLYQGILAIIYNQALRFCIDYLNGNIYYPVSYDDQNLIRCRNQIRLLEEVINNRHFIENTIEKFCR